MPLDCVSDGCVAEAVRYTRCESCGLELACCVAHAKELFFCIANGCEKPVFFSDLCGECAAADSITVAVGTNTCVACRDQRGDEATVFRCQAHFQDTCAVHGVPLLCYTFKSQPIPLTGPTALSVHGTSGVQQPDVESHCPFADLKSRPRLRMMSWNIQCLGGRFGQPEVRDPAVILAIATVIHKTAPHVVSIMEVLGTKGLKEIERIYEALVALDGGGNWKWLSHPGQAMTGGETYVFFYRGDCIVPANALGCVPGTYTTEDASGKQLNFPARKYRHPMQATFRVTGPLRSRKADGDWLLGGVVFHAPSPSHGEDTGKGVFALGRVPLLQDAPTAFVAADLNLPLDDSEEVPAARLRDSYYAGLEEMGFFAWPACQNPLASTLRRAPIIEIAGWDDSYEVDIDDSAWDDTARAELTQEWKNLLPNVDMAKVIPTTVYKTREEYLAHWQAYWNENATPDMFVCASYDQLLIKSDADKDGILYEPQVWLYQLGAAVTPPDGELFKIVSGLYPAKETVGAADFLRVANKISDHMPVLMEAVIL